MLDCSVHATRKGYATLKGQMTAKHFGLLNGLPGAKRWQDRVLHFETTASNLEYIVTHLYDDINFSSDIQQRIADIERKRRAEAEFLASKDLPPEAFNFPFKTKPFDHQLKAFNLGRDKTNFAYFMEMGTGKTKTICDVAAYKFQRGEIDSMLVLAPNGIHRQWADQQIPIHLPDFVERELYVYKAGAPKKILEAIQKLNGFDGLRIMLMNIEALSTERGTLYARAFLAKNKCFLVVDESTRIKSPSAQRTKNVKSVGTMAVARAILTGGPVTKGLEDLYSQLNFLDQDILGFSSFYTFRNHYCIMGGYEQKEIVSYRNVPELLQRLDSHSIIIKKKDCLDLPEKMYVEREVDLSEEQRTLYERLKDEFLVELDGGMIEAPLAITRLMRLQQIISGFIGNIVEGKSVINEVPGKNPRIEAVDDILDETEHKVIIWSRFVRDVDTLYQRYKKRGALWYHGAANPEHRAAAIERFQNDPSARIFIGNPQTAGTGLNLTAANTVIYFANSFDADQRWQSEDRCHRIGQRNPVTYIDLVAPKTIDRHILRALKNKKSIAEMVSGQRNISALLSNED